MAQDLKDRDPRFKQQLNVILIF